ncbi:MAG TPA: hypothetical protein VFG83_16235 [Kofleriaceae bacterium]|nr:hypothetical protein [Kofleriaceae bacterium]
MDDRISKVVRDAIVDVAQIVQTRAHEAKGELKPAAAASSAGTVVAVLGGFAAAFGGGVFLALPVVPRGNKRLRRRMFAASLIYTVGGASAAVAGLLSVRKTLGAAVSHTVHDIKEAGGTVEDLKQAGAAIAKGAAEEQHP